MSHSFATAWTVGHQAPLSMGLSHQEYWSWLLFPPLGDLPDPGIKPASPALREDSLLSEPPHLFDKLSQEAVENGCSLPAQILSLTLFPNSVKKSP